MVSGLIGRLSVIRVPPSLAIFAFLRWSRRSWFFFMRAISSSNLPYVNHYHLAERGGGGQLYTPREKGGGKGAEGGEGNIPFLRPRVTVDVACRG